MGVVRSVKHEALYLEVKGSSSSRKGGVLARLHMIECQSAKEFSNYTKGDQVEAKILQVTENKLKGQTWLELTRRKAHMK